MNNLIESTYALRLLWSYIKCKYNLKNIKYLILPIIYLIVTLISVPAQVNISNSVTRVYQDSYRTVTITIDEKISYILDKYDLSKKQFKILCGIVLSEAEQNSYEDAYAVINTIYNRTQSKNWVNSVNRRYGQGKGVNLYYQAISPNQFTVYQSGAYLKNVNNINNIGYIAVIDFLYNEEVMHNYLSFRSNSSKINNYEKFSEKGNKYFNILELENRI